MVLPALYCELASWWPLMSAPEEYAEEAALYLRAMMGASDRPLQTLLELGSGGGNNASHMKAHVSEMVLVDVSPGMLAVSGRLNPQCEHVESDMRTARLGRQFDAVFVHDSVCYMTTEGDLRRAMDTAFVHCLPGGVALFAPDHVRENFRPSTDHGGHDGDGRSLRYLEWTWDPDPHDTTYTVDYTYVLREGTELPRVQLDRHLEGLFSRQEWLAWLAQAGFEAAAALPIDHSDLEPGQYEVFVCRRPARP